MLATQLATCPLNRHLLPMTYPVLFSTQNFSKNIWIWRNAEHLLRYECIACEHVSKQACFLRSISKHLVELMCLVEGRPAAETTWLHPLGENRLLL